METSNATTILACLPIRAASATRTGLSAAALASAILAAIGQHGPVVPCSALLAAGAAASSAKHPAYWGAGNPGGRACAGLGIRATLNVTGQAVRFARVQG